MINSDDQNNTVCDNAADRVLVQCLTNSSTVLVECMDDYYLRMTSAVVYKSASSCPSTPATDACWHSNSTDLSNTTCLRNDSSCLLTVPELTSPLPCSLATHPGDYYAVVDYRCQPGSLTLLTLNFTNSTNGKEARWMELISF